jgi:chromosomal replication initiator protein
MSENITFDGQSWQSCLKYISLRVKNHSFNTWFKHTKVSPDNNGGLKLIVPNQFVADWLESHYFDLICEAIRDIVGKSLELNFEVSSIGSEAQTEIDFRSYEPESDHTEREELNTERLNERYRFENMVVGGFNQFAHAAARAVAEAPGATNYNPLFIYGGTGLGKTHLAQAIGGYVQNKVKNKKVMYASSEKFTSDFINSLSNGTISHFTSKYRSVDVLLIDDIQFFSGKESTQEQFFHTFNDLYHAGKQIVLTSDRHPRDTKGLEERLLSRFSSGLVADLQIPDLETKVAILRSRAKSEGTNIPEDVLYFIAENVTSNIRELEGYLTRLTAYASLEKVDIDLEFARRVLGKDIIRPRKNLTISGIQKFTADHFQMDVATMISRKRTSQIVLCRQVGMYLARKHTSLSLKSIGDAFGGRDHSTVIHACELIDSKLQEDPDLVEKVESLSHHLFN